MISADNAKPENPRTKPAVKQHVTAKISSYELSWVNDKIESGKLFITLRGISALAVGLL